MQLQMNVLASQLFSSVVGIKFLLLTIVTAGRSNVKTVLSSLFHVGLEIILTGR